ncbi:hypothetical protein PybrP1_001873 [[Pythium] brassicae (nom. inval.)]|nr:hypothetical protein PybrP1_001873 [[Pythium] brassicae (nom. inval.)]
MATEVGGSATLQLLLTFAVLVVISDANEVSSLLRGPTDGLVNHRDDNFATLASLQQGQHRMLATEDTVNSAVDKANEIGASVRKAIRQLRGGSDRFYRDVITAVKILLCEEKVKDTGSASNPKNRYVDATDPLAYKDKDGNCIRITLTAMSDDTMRTEYTVNKKCEVQPNCYWGNITVATDTDRAPMYATDQSMQPVEGAMTYDDAKDKVTKWAQGLMIFVVPGIILAVLSLLTMVFFLICRCCCNRCGGRSPKEGGYTCMQKFLPLLFFLLFAIGVVVVAGVSLLYQKTVMAAVSDTFDATSGTLVNASAWINNIQTPLENIRDKVLSSADSVSQQLADTSFIDDGINSLTTALGTFEQGSAGRTLPSGCTVSNSNPYCVACTVCTSVSTKVAAARKQIEDNAGPGVAALKDVKVTLNSKLVSIKDSVRTQVNEQVENTDEFIVTIDDVRGDVEDVREQYDKQKVAQQAGVLVLFALGLVVIALGVVGILFGLTPLKFLANVIHIAYFVGFIALILTFLVSSIFLAISVLLGDACEVTMIFTEDWTVPLGSTAKGVNACFQNESLIDVLDLSSSLEFARGGIKFPDSIDPDKLLDFSSLDAFATTIQGTDTSTFPLDQTKINDGIAVLNKYTKQADGVCVVPDGKYTEANILSPWTANSETKGASATAADYMASRYARYDQLCVTPGDGVDFACTNADGTNPTPCAFSAFVRQTYTRTSTLVAIKTDAGAFVAELKRNMTVVTDTTTTFKTKTRDMNNKVNAIKSDLQTSIIKYVDDFEKAMYCTFIMDGFFQIYHALCGDLMPAFTMISLMLFLAGVFLFPVNVCLIIALKRLKARGNGSHVMDNEMKFK